MNPGGNKNANSRVQITGDMRDILGNVDENGWPLVDNQSFLVSNIKDAKREFEEIDVSIFLTVFVFTKDYR